MKHVLFLLSIGLIFSFASCEKISQDVVELSVDFSWEGVKQCKLGNPEIRVGGVPGGTNFLIIEVFDHAYSHEYGTVKFPYIGDSTIAKDRFKEIQAPCPAYTPSRYEITIKAVDEKEAVIGIGSRERIFPEKK